MDSSMCYFKLQHSISHGFHLKKDGDFSADSCLFLPSLPHFPFSLSNIQHWRETER
uniref:Uncharacterized protein n=1 Tax=Vitis vinifera TaxID=29760 RepID=F6HAM0_VITVI